MHAATNDRRIILRPSLRGTSVLIGLAARGRHDGGAQVQGTGQDRIGKSLAPVLFELHHRAHLGARTVSRCEIMSGWPLGRWTCTVVHAGIGG